MAQTTSNRVGDVFVWTVVVVAWTLFTIVWIPLCLVYVLITFPLVFVKRALIDRVVMAILLRGDVETAWKRCLPGWIRQNGAWEDNRFVHRSPNIPTFATRLARAFAAKFPDEYLFLAKRVASRNEDEANCAIELLAYICFRMKELPDELLRSQTPIPRRELPPSRSHMTLGEFLPYQSRDRFDEWEALWQPWSKQSRR